MIHCQIHISHIHHTRYQHSLNIEQTITSSQSVCAAPVSPKKIGEKNLSVIDENNTTLRRKSNAMSSQNKDVSVQVDTFIE